MKYFKFIVIQILIIGCTATNFQNPETVLKEYVDYRFSKHQTRPHLLKYATAFLRQSIEEMTEKDFHDFKKTHNYKKRKFKINLKKCSGDQCHLTYTVTYDIIKENRNLYSVEVKKIAELHRESNTWKIASISNIKTFLDSKISIDL